MSLLGSYGARKDRKIYGNCQVYSPDNILMFRCDEKRAKWYLIRDLAEVVGDNPFSIRLNFKPKGLGNHNKQFGLVEMKNICVVCGIDEYLTRHHVIPHCYRKYFPLCLKSHNFHDVLSMCVNCHEKYERKADDLKIELSIKYKSPIGGEVQNSKEVLKYTKIAKTLLISKEIPRYRQKVLKNKLKEYFGIKRLTKLKISQISDIKTLIVKKTHGQIVIEKVTNLQEFVEMWRYHFISNNDCKFLPKDWNIKTKIENE